MKGTLIKTLVNKKLQPDKYKIMWNGIDKNGDYVKHGIYLITIRFDGKPQNQVKLMKH